MDLRESSRQPKSCGLCRTPGHNKTNCPNRPNANVTEETWMLSNVSNNVVLNYVIDYAVMCWNIKLM
jgi:hypothetical protein